MNGDELEKCQTVAIKLARDAGHLMCQSREANDGPKVESKSSWRDLVTEVDRNVERMIFDSLKKHYPGHRFIGEESATNCQLADDSPTWIVDPIDGTVNFVHRSPFCCVAIGLAVKGQMVLGVIYAPFLDRLYTAVRGQGAKCNGKPIRVAKPVSKIEHCLMVYEPNYGNQEYGEAIFNNLLWKCQGVRNVGSACLTLCLLAEGAADAFYHEHLAIWDFAAGYVILTEAGGLIIHADKDHFDLNSKNILAASNPTLAADVASKIRIG